MVVWRDHKGSSPALIVVDNDRGPNELTWIAHRLGYRWGVNCDVNYYDDAAYWTSIGNAPAVRREFAYLDDNAMQEGRMPYHRMVLYTRGQ